MIQVDLSHLCVLFISFFFPLLNQEFDIILVAKLRFRSAMAIDGWDFLDWLGADTSARIFTHLDDPADLVRSASVSRSWNKFITSNGFVKNLCIRLCPEASNFVSNSSDDHSIYSNLIKNLVSDNENQSCISKCIAASSTDRFPDERIENTLESEEVVRGRLSYWSSKGEKDSDKSETLIYGLVSDLCIVDEIKIRPWLALHYDNQVYSAKFVRFKLGGLKFSDSWPNERNHFISDDNLVWTYTSPEFPMQQENELQSFKLPRPVLCIGGVVQIELIGRAQRCYIDNLFYVCVTHVQVIGRPVSGLALTINISEASSGEFVNQYSISEAQ
ncbi:hypothetical protein LUZ60_014682 [Juncus effusus]|nr:hypothetical protein LUZ60_014682 [Juncus effusus]